MSYRPVNLVMMGWYSQGFLSYYHDVTALSLQTFEHQRIFARTSAVTHEAVIV